MTSSYPVDFSAWAVNETPTRPAIKWVESTLARYPDVTADELTHLVGWFKVASALDVGLMASNEVLHDAYVAFRKEHLDRFTWGDLVRAVLFILFFGGGATAIILRAMG